MSRVIVQMIVRNESQRYLKEVLSDACNWSDLVIIVDDCSDDNTIDICRSFSPKVRVFNHNFGRSMFGEDESKLRNYLWELVRQEAKINDLIVSLDADEIFSSNFKNWVRGFAGSVSEYTRVTFKLCDMWDWDHYRVDGLWSPLITRVFRFKDEPFGLTGIIHSGCLPAYSWVGGKEYVKTDIKLKHLGWERNEDKDRKYHFYMERATGVNLTHAKTIVDPPLLHEYKEELPNVVISSLIRNRAWCLPQFLKALGRQVKTYPANKLSFLFILNDSLDDSENIIENWIKSDCQNYKEIKIIKINFGNSDSVDHTWSDAKLQNMAIMRDKCLEYLKNSDNEFLFSIDSDVILEHDDVLKHLVGLDKSVVSEVFWATWEKKDIKKPLPNVWISGGYFLTEGFLQQLKRPGVYEVGGLGAITLIHRDVVERGVNYQRVMNLPNDMRGEDRDFSVRATCSGFRLFADTFRTPTHLERTDEEKLKDNQSLLLKDVDNLKIEANNTPEKLNLEPGENTVSLCMIVKNEERNLRGALSSVKPFVQEMIIVDTGSIDKTKEIAKEFTDKIYDFEWCDNYSAARNFALSKATNKWILFLDGDELIPPETLKHFHEIIKSKELTAILVPVKNIVIPTKEKPVNYHYSETYRLFRNRTEIKFNGCVHEDIAESLERLGKIEKVGVMRSTQFITNLGFLIKQGDLKSKHDYYGKLLLKEINLNPTSFKPYYEYAVYLLDKGQLDEAERYYHKSLNLNPNFHMARNDLGVIKLKRAFDPDLILEAAADFDIAAISASKGVSVPQQKTISTNIGIVRQIIKFLNIPISEKPKIQTVIENGNKEPVKEVQKTT